MANHDDVLRGWPMRGAALPPAPRVPYPDQHWDWAAINALPQVDPTAWVAPGAVVYGRAQRERTAETYRHYVNNGIAHQAAFTEGELPGAP